MSSQPHCHIAAFHGVRATVAPSSVSSRWYPGAPGSRTESPYIRLYGPAGPARTSPSAPTATKDPESRSSTAPSREAEIATRPARSPSSTADTLSSVHETHVVGAPRAASDPGRCQSLPPTGIAAGSHACHQDSGVVHDGSSHDQCQTSSSGGRRGIGCTHELGPANGWLTDITPPRDSARDSHDEAGSRKSIHPVSPSTPACPSSVVTSCPGSSITPYLAEA